MRQRQTAKIKLGRLPYIFPKFGELSASTSTILTVAIKTQLLYIYSSHGINIIPTIITEQAAGE